MSRNAFSGLSPKIFHYCVYKAHMDFSMPQQHSHRPTSRPRHLAYRVRGRQIPKPSIQGRHRGLALHNLQVPAVLVVLSGCVVAREKPLCALAQFATSLSLLFPSIMLFAGFLRRILGKALQFLAGVLQKYQKSKMDKLITTFYF